MIKGEREGIDERNDCLSDVNEFFLAYLYIIYIRVYTYTYVRVMYALFFRYEVRKSVVIMPQTGVTLMRYVRNAFIRFCNAFYFL
jgi:hypothetical protein